VQRADLDVYELWEQYVGPPLEGGDPIELARSALVLSKLAYPHLALEYPLSRLNAIAAGVRRQLMDEADPLAALNTLSQYLFDELGFRGNQEDYYDPRNSYLNDVLSRRLGIPITLSLLYIEVGQRAGMPLVGVGLPGHFLVAHEGVPDLFVDAFHGGTLLTAAECRARFHAVTSPDTPWVPAYLAPVSSRAFLARIMQNLKQIYLRERRRDLALAMQTLLVMLHPHEADPHRDRGMLLYEQGDYEGALEELTAYLGLAPRAKDRNFVYDLSKRIRTELER
jgi:regulator of sirC expression with transglutaminase-like and TPR domain